MWILCISLYNKNKQKKIRVSIFDSKYYSQNLDDFRKSMQNTYWLYQKVKQLEANSSKGILGLSHEGGNNIFSLLPPPPCQGFRKCWYLPHCYSDIELGLWTSTEKNFRYENIKIFVFKSNHIAKQCKTSLQDLCNMLPFVKGNLDRYFVCSFAIFFLFLWAITNSHKLFLLQEKWHQKEKCR